MGCEREAVDGSVSPTQGCEAGAALCQAAAPLLSQHWAADARVSRGKKRVVTSRASVRHE